MYTNNVFNRDGSTLGVMDDLQIAVHTYDGCSRGCSGCLVDKHFKNKSRFQGILTDEQLKIIDSRVKEYFQWTQEYLNNKNDGYFGENGYKVKHYSYTMRFGNHSELNYDELYKIASMLESDYKVFSTAPTEDIEIFNKLSKDIPARYFLEIIYDPIFDDALYLRNMILKMRENNILGYPEVLITQRLLKAFSPEDFVNKKVVPLGDIGTQMQFGRYSPSKTRNFNKTQVVNLDMEVEWLRDVAKNILDKNLNIHPIPIAEYAVTLLDEYKEIQFFKNGEVKEDLMIDNVEMNSAILKDIKDKTRDIFLTSLYIDHNLDVFIWSESMGQHVLDNNLGFEAIGNLHKESIIEMVTKKDSKVEKLLNDVIRNLLNNKKCRNCRYKSFCASHAINLFRKWHEDDGKHCYGYIPVIREFQKNHQFLNNMIKGFKDLDF